MSKLADWIISRLGGYTQAQWRGADRKHDKELAEKDRVIMELARLPDSTPADCKRGEWCSWCVYAKKKIVHTGSYPYQDSHVVYHCGKEGVCKNLTFKEDRLYG